MFKVNKDLPGIPMHKLFTPATEYPIVFRFANTKGFPDDAIADIRGASFRLLKEDHPNDIHDGIHDFCMNSGPTFPFHTAALFKEYTGVKVAGNITQWLRSQPQMYVDSFYEGIRDPDSYAQLKYYSQLPTFYNATNGDSYFARYRMRPASGDKDENKKIDKDVYYKKYYGCDCIPRQEGDTRSATYLRDELSEKIMNGDTVKFKLEVALHPINDINETLRCNGVWDEAKYPYREIGVLEINKLLLPSEIGQKKLHFNPGYTHPDAAVVRAQSPYDTASVMHLRCIVYESMENLVRYGLPVFLVRLVKGLVKKIMFIN